MAAPHTLPVGDVLDELGTTPEGLSQEEARRRLERHGPNELSAAPRLSPSAIFVAQFKNVLIVILLVAVALSIVLGEATEAVVIGLIVVITAMLGFVQEYRAERAIESLRKMAAPTARVRRGGRELVVPARELVPGDIVVLHAGDRVPADLRLIEAVNLQIDESALTGESTPVEKHTNPLPDPALPVADRANMAWAGTIVTYGRGAGVVVATGMDTQFGSIAGMLATIEVEKTPLQQHLDRVGRVLAGIALAVVAVIAVLGIARGEGLLAMLLFGVALAVAVVPEALPAVVTISLALGMQRIARRNALVKRLPAVETLGSTSVICTDKTGTLTRNEMTVRAIALPGLDVEVTGSGYEPVGEFRVDGRAITPPASLRDLLEVAVLASDATVTHDGGRWVVNGDPTEGALVVAAAKAGIDKAELERRAPRVAEIPFTSERKRMTTLHDTETGRLAASKGAVEVVLASCSTVHADGRVEPLTEQTRRQILERADAMARQGLRVLAVAVKQPATVDDAERDMTFLGLVGMVDPPRPEARAAVAACATAGIEVVMITGDHPATAQAIATELGILTDGHVVTGAELGLLSDDELRHQVRDIEVYARVSPADKLRVVDAWKANDAIVAMTGDGVNDAPALKRADIGVAMGITGTDVSKEAADMVLLDDNFASIVAAVEEGRGIFDNIKKYLMYLLSSNFGEVLLIAAATLAGMPLPVTAVQILYVNLATDGLPALALSVDPPAPDLMRRPPRDPRRGVFTRAVMSLMGAGGLWSAAVTLTVFTTSRAAGAPIEVATTRTFVCLVMIELLKAYAFRSDRHSVARSPFANRWLNLAVGWEAIALVAVTALPALQAPFGTVTLQPVTWLTLLAAAATIIPVLELVKWAIRRGWLASPD